MKKTKKTPAERALYADERAKFEFDMLKNPKTGKIPEGIHERELKQVSLAPSLSQQLKGTGITVTPRGPNNLGGRTRAIAFDVSDATNSTILAGGVSSGVFRTTNLGSSWTKVSPNDEIHNVTAIAQDTRAGQQNVWYYGTGEGLGNSASLGSAYRGYGIWKSINGGLNWARLPNSSPSDLETFECEDYIWRIAVDPTNGNVYAAIPNAIIRSTDGGANWSIVIGSGCANSIAVQTDVVISPTGVVYAAFSGEAGTANDGVWRSISGNAGSYTRIAGNTSPTGWNAAANYGRVVLALAPSDEAVLYALYDNETGGGCATPAPEADFFRYDTLTNNWTDLSANLPDEAGCLSGNDPFAIQGGYDLCVAVKPDDPNTVFVGGTNVYRSTDGFSTTGNTTRIGGYVSASSYGLYPNHHPDIHILVFAPNGGGGFDEDEILFTGTDGGIHNGDITEATVSWNSMNNDYVTYQYYHSAISPAIGSNTLIGGTQDNGTTETTAGTNHSRILGGDGVAVGIASASGPYYIGTQAGSIRRYTGSSTVITPNASNSIFVTYFHLDPDNTEYLYYASLNTVYRTISASTVNSGSWFEMTGIGSVMGGEIRSLATSRSSGYASSDANRKLYIGTSNGEVWRLNDPAFTATNTIPVEITPPTASGGLVSSISVNPSDDNEIMLTYSNYGINSVFHTNNANAANPTWTNIEGNIPLPSFRASSIVDAGGGDIFYLVGTSVGLYCTQTLAGGGTVWSRVGPNSIGYALVSQLALRPVDNFLVAGTHGNGMYMLEVPSVPTIAFSEMSSTSAENGVNTISCRSYEDISISMLITNAPTGAATVTISNTGTATEGVDYEILNPSKQLTFPDGSTASQDVNIRIYDDTNPEGNESIILDFTVSGTTNAEKANANITHTLNLRDNDFIPASIVTVWEEDFENGITFGNFAGTDWASGGFGGTSFNSLWRTGSAGGMTGAQSAYVSDDNGASASYDKSAVENLVLRTEVIDATAFADMTLTFDFKSNGNPGSDYGILSYSLNGSNFTNIEGNTLGPYTGVTASTNRTVALPAALNNQNFYLGFRWINDDDGAGTDPPFTIDNLRITTPFEPAVETVLNSSDEQNFGPNETVFFYIGGDLIASLKNNSTYDYGCTSVTIDRAGTAAEAAWSNVAGEELASKTVLITPTNNAPAAGQTYDLTLYYTQAEFDGWVANSDVAHTTADFKLVKSSGAIQDLNIGSTNASVNTGTSYAAYGTDHSFTATFDGGFSGFGGGDPSSPTFPVEFISFTAEQAGADVKLDWSTALEINSDRFEIERSEDGISFSKIGSVASTGGQNGAVYTFYDQSPLTGTNVYRLRQVDIDGRYDYSTQVEVSFEAVLIAKIGPNPFQTYFNLELADPGKHIYEFELFDLKGEKLYERRLEFTDRLNEKVDLPNLATG
ncbi:MAG: hypothetical protein AAF696_17425, partial [Bacteroidota bacterium]